MKIRKNKDETISIRCSAAEFVHIRASLATVQYIESCITIGLPYWDDDAEIIKSKVKDEYMKRMKQMDEVSIILRQIEWYEWEESHPSQTTVKNDIKEK